MTSPALRILELYAGIGGAALALADHGTIMAALDVDRDALTVYGANLPHPTVVKNLEFVSSRELAAFGADLWWLSPPCQPFTTKGLQRDHEDPRSRSLLHLIQRIAEVRPRFLALENVPGFLGSECHRRLRRSLGAADYEVRETLLCPSELGWPNRRRRYYLVASRAGSLAPSADLRGQPWRRLTEFLDQDPAPDLTVPPDRVERYQGALHRVLVSDPSAITACFASGYGRQWVRSGSYLVQSDGSWRRFSPAEILRLLDFPQTYRLPAELRPHRAYDLIGNSVSLPALRAVLAALPAQLPKP